MALKKIAYGADSALFSSLCAMFKNVKKGLLDERYPYIMEVLDQMKDAVRSHVENYDDHDEYGDMEDELEDLENEDEDEMKSTAKVVQTARKILKKYAQMDDTAKVNSVIKDRLRRMNTYIMYQVLGQDYLEDKFSKPGTHDRAADIYKSPQVKIKPPVVLSGPQVRGNQLYYQIKVRPEYNDKKNEIMAAAKKYLNFNINPYYTPDGSNKSYYINFGTAPEMPKKDVGRAHKQEPETKMTSELTEFIEKYPNVKLKFIRKDTGMPGVRTVHRPIPFARLMKAPKKSLVKYLNEYELVDPKDNKWLNIVKRVRNIQ